MEMTPEQIREILTVQTVTEELLQELQALGFRSKRVAIYQFSDTPGGAGWQGLNEHEGRITLHRDFTPGAVAHELGHGFHECLWRDRCLPNLFGEDYAEAIRWFVEGRLGWSAWPRDFQNRTNKKDAVLRLCGYDWPTFLQNLRDGRFYPDL